MPLEIERKFLVLNDGGFASQRIGLGSQ